jgi:hypothetical protein
VGRSCKPNVGDYLVGSSGTKFTARTAQLEKNKNGKFMFDNQALKIDDDVDTRLKRVLSHWPSPV